MRANTQHDSVTIRRASPDDLGHIEALLRDASLPVEGVRNALPAFLVAEVDGAIVGVVGMEYRGRYGLLRSTAVGAARCRPRD